VVKREDKPTIDRKAVRKRAGEELDRQRKSLTNLARAVQRFDAREADLERRRLDPGRFKGFKRPYPPVEFSIGRSVIPLFRPAPELEEWAVDTFVSGDGKLSNEDHLHLSAARLGFLWTSFPAMRQGLVILGQSEIPSPPPSLGSWARARWTYQIEEWFGDEALDFLITIYAPYAIETDNASFCALIEHELYHCGQKLDEFGIPKYRRDGQLTFAIRGHDVEEFVGVVARYGVAASAGRTKELVAAGNRAPSIATAKISGACGTCALKVA